MHYLVAKGNDKVLISRYIPIEGTRLFSLHQNPDMIRPYSSINGPENDLIWLMKKLREAGIDPEPDYEYVLEEISDLPASALTVP